MSTNNLRIHEVRTWPVPFEAMWIGKKNYEIRRDDRGYGVGDLLISREFEPRGSVIRARYSGRAMLVRVTYMTPGGQFYLPADICIMSCEVLARVASYTIGCFDSHIFRVREGSL